jgi:aspartate/methionine/tyrosine aminotransferase
VTDPYFARLLASLTAPDAGYARPADDAAGGVVDWDLEVGEARYPLPVDVRSDIGRVVAELGRVWYSSPVGEAALQNAYQDHVGLPVDSRCPAQVLVTAGGKEAAWLAVRYLLHRGEVAAALVPSPGWEPYRLWLQAAGCVRIPYDPLALAEAPMLLRQWLIDAAVRPGLLIVNYPHNPTGAAVSQAGMDEIVQIAAEHGLFVVSDEVYRVFGQDGVSAVFAPDRDLARHFVVDSCSKALTVAGLRVGFLLADAGIVADLAAFRAAYASCTSVLTQRVATLLLDSDVVRAWLGEVRAAVNSDREVVAAALTDRGVQVVSHGGLYVWCRTPDPAALAEVPQGGSARFTPGGGFGAPDHFRLCVARAGLDPAAAVDAVVSTLRRH